MPRLSIPPKQPAADRSAPQAHEQLTANDFNQVVAAVNELFERPAGAATATGQVFTRDELLALARAGGLVPGQHYLLEGFRTTEPLLGDPGEFFSPSGSERLLLLAESAFTFHFWAKSLSYEGEYVELDLFEEHFRNTQWGTQQNGYIWWDPATASNPEAYGENATGLGFDYLEGVPPEALPPVGSEIWIGVYSNDWYTEQEHGNYSFQGEDGWLRYDAATQRLYLKPFAQTGFPADVDEVYVWWAWCPPIEGYPARAGVTRNRVNVQRRISVSLDYRAWASRRTYANFDDVPLVSDQTGRPARFTLAKAANPDYYNKEQLFIVLGEVAPWEATAAAPCRWLPINEYVWTYALPADGRISVPGGTVTFPLGNSYYYQELVNSWSDDVRVRGWERVELEDGYRVPVDFTMRGGNVAIGYLYATGTLGDFDRVRVRSSLGGRIFVTGNGHGLEVDQAQDVSFLAHASRGGAHYDIRVDSLWASVVTGYTKGLHAGAISSSVLDNCQGSRVHESLTYFHGTLEFSELARCYNMARAILYRSRVTELSECTGRVALHDARVNYVNQNSGEVSVSNTEIYTVAGCTGPVTLGNVHGRLNVSYCGTVTVQDATFPVFTSIYPTSGATKFTPPSGRVYLPSGSNGSLLYTELSWDGTATVATHGVYELEQPA